MATQSQRIDNRTKRAIDNFLPVYPTT